MRAVVLVAGMSSRLRPLTEIKPKCLIDVGGKTIFDWQMQALRSCGIKDVHLVVGYRREQVVEHAHRVHPDLNFTIHINHIFFETNTAYSLLIAADAIRNQDFVYFNGDVLFEPRLLQATLDGPPNAALAVERKPCGKEEVKVVVDQQQRILEISKEVDPDQALGEFIGVARFGAKMTPAFVTALQGLEDEGNRSAYFERALEKIAGKEELSAVDITGMPCIEIDFLKDYNQACQSVVQRFDKKLF